MKLGANTWIWTSPLTDEGLAELAPKLRDWGFDLSGITVPISVWQGQQDLMVPFAHGGWLAAHIPGARAHLRPEHGHLSLAVGAFGDVLDDLLEAGGLTATTIEG